MIFSTYTFLVFFLVTLILYAIVPGRVKPWVLIAGGCVFYAYDSIPYFFLLLVVTLVVYAISRGMRPSLLMLGIIGSVGLLGFYKYWKLFARSWNEWFPSFSVPVYHIAVPLAISFFVFEFIHYLMDLRRGKAKPVSLRTFLVFIFFFPSMVAGPIKRIQSFHEDEAHQMRWDDVQAGLTRMAIGTFKKIVFADSLNPLFVGAFADPAGYSQVGLWVGMYAYAFKIYIDFSAYSDMAIGAARCFGYTLPENFNWPYISRNLTEFWRRWHISLSTWIRDYLYISMGGSRKGYAKMLLFVFLSMTISGLWHGANWTFLIWGIWHGAGQVVQKLWNRMWERSRGGQDSDSKQTLLGRTQREGAYARTAMAGEDPEQRAEQPEGGLPPTGESAEAVSAPAYPGLDSGDRSGALPPRSEQASVGEVESGRGEQLGSLPPRGALASAGETNLGSGERSRSWLWRVSAPLRHTLAWAVTFHFVCLGWVFFASPDVTTAFRYLARMWMG